MHIGDGLEDDVKGARAAGIEPILVHRQTGVSAPATDYHNQTQSNKILPDNSDCAPVKTIQKLTELLGLI